MDLLKLFALLVAVATVRISAEGPKKKIRIHLPQKVKHIHHHKKIYITNHPAASQYAPAYMPSAEGALAVPTRVALPAPGGLLAAGSNELYEEAAPAGSKMLPLYHARGYYGPSPTAAPWDDQDYDLSPPPESEHSYPTAFADPAPPAPRYPHKKVKVVKVNDAPRKKAVRKGKPTRVPARTKPALDEEIPVSTFHEHFYSDLDGSATLKKVKKPQRVEKIIDGNTEHIHTYSEEHIHKLIYDDGSSKLVGVDSAGSMSALSPAHHIFPVKNSLVALSHEPLIASIGSMGTPSHLEYASYNPRDVTHDHVFHDHGEISSDAEVLKENLPYAPRVSYNSQGIQIGSHGKGQKNKFPIQPYPKQARPAQVNDYSYYESMYSPYGRQRLLRPTNPASLYSITTEEPLEDYRQVPSFKLRDKVNIKPHTVPDQLSTLYFGGKQAPDYRPQQTSDPSPFAVSSTVVHDYKPKTYASQTTNAFGYNNFNDPLHNFKDSSYTSNFDLDSFASASNSYTSNEKFNPLPYPGKRGKKKSISTQNIRIGGLDHQTTVDHLADSGLATFLNDGLPSTLNFGPTKTIEAATSTPYTIRGDSLVHPYYSAMAAKALHGVDQMEEQASNTNFQYVEAPTTEIPMVATTNIPHEYFDQEMTEAVPTESTQDSVETMPVHNAKNIKDLPPNIVKDSRQRIPEITVKDYKSVERPTLLRKPKRLRGLRPDSETPGQPGSRKYGDKI